MKKSKRNFLIASLFVLPTLLMKNFSFTNNFINKKIKIYKKKYSKIWLLDINDS